MISVQNAKALLSQVLQEMRRTLRHCIRIESTAGNFGTREEVAILVNQSSINQREICTAPLYTFRSANSSQW